MRVSIIMALVCSFCLFISVAWSVPNTEAPVTANEVVQTFFKVHKSDIAKKINKDLKQKKWKKGKFFKGHVGELEAALDKLDEKDIPQVIEIDNGFQLQAGKQKVIIEFVNILAGKIRINDVPVRLTKKMTFNELVKVVNRAVSKKKKRTTYNPFNLIIPEANAVVWVPVIVVGGAAAAVIDYGFGHIAGAMHDATSSIGGKKDEFHKYMSDMSDKCKKDRGGRSKDGKAISELAKAFKKIEEKRKDQTDADKKETDVIQCKAIAEKRDFDYESPIFGFDVYGYIKKGCDSFKALKKCLKNKNFVIDDTDRNDVKNSQFGDIYEALQETYGNDFQK